MRADNHAGPKYAEVRAAYPKATRFHWTENAFRAGDAYWLVGTPSAFGGGGGITWQHVKPDDLARV